MTIYSLDVLFSLFETSLISCPVLTVASWSAYRFLKRQVRWSGNPISFRIFHSLLWTTQSKALGIVNKAEIDIFLKLSCFFNNPMDVGNLISGSSAFSKTSLNIWKFMVQVLLKPGLEKFEYYFASVWDEFNCAVVWAFFGTAFLWDWRKLTFSIPAQNENKPKLKTLMYTICGINIKIKYCHKFISLFSRAQFYLNC